MTTDDLLQRVQIGMTREAMFAALGQPTDIENVSRSRKYRIPCIFKYGEIELHFKKGKTGGLWLVYTEDADGNPKTLLQ